MLYTFRNSNLVPVALSLVIVFAIWSNAVAGDYCPRTRESEGPAEEISQGGAENGSRFAGAAESKNAALRPASGVTSSPSRLVT